MAEEYMTYEEWIDAGNSIADITGDTVAEALTEKFFDRYLGWDSTTFNRYYRRNLNVFMPRFLELQRFEPGGLNTDWLAQDFHMSKYKSSNTGDKKTGASSDKITNTKEINADDETRTRTGATEKVYNIDNLQTGATERIYDIDEKDTGTQNTDKNNTTTHNTTINHTDDHTTEQQGRTISTENGGNTVDYSGTANDGTHQSKALDGTYTQDSGVDATHGFAGGRSMSKQLPMSTTFLTANTPKDTATLTDAEGNSKEYHIYANTTSTLPANDNFYNGADVGATDSDGNPTGASIWLNASAITGDRSANDNFTQYGHRVTQNGGTEDTQTADAKDSHKETDQNFSETVTSHDGDKEVYNSTGADATTGTEADAGNELRTDNLAHAKTGSETENYNDITHKQTGTETDNYNDIKDITNATGNKNIDGTENLTSNGTENTTNTENTQRRETGRHEAPADILNRTVAYIEQTNAFSWLCEQLDSCFLAIYE